MNILLAASEVTPYAKAGGLADVTGAMPVEWAKFGQNSIVIMPKYGFIDTDHFGLRPTDLVLYVPMGNWVEFARLWEGKLPYSEVPIYFIENKDYFERPNIYGSPHEYADNDRRFIFLSRAVFEAAKALNFKPDILHAHDFHTAFSMAFLKSWYRYDPIFSITAGVYTIHNLAYQGWFDPKRAMEFTGFGMKEFYPGSWFELHGTVNAMKTGIMFADKITTVSPTYAEEIRNPYYGEGLEDVLNHKGEDLIGILNGAYYDEWNPESDPMIHFGYSSESIDKKRINKEIYLNGFGLTEDDDLDKPLIGMVSRLTGQKGIDLIREKMEEFIASGNFRFTLLGSGDYHHEEYFRNLAKKYPRDVLVSIGYNNHIAHRIMASSDFLVIPSRYEPCGLTQMYALKYGTVPIVRNTGGLADTVVEYNPEKGKGTGFVFLHYWGEDFAFALRRALRIYNKQPHWDIIRRNAMAENFSSAKSALEYLKAFKWALEKVR